jgi:hypothetical protein
MSVTRTAKVTKNTSVVRKAAEGVALQVLRDALIGMEGGEKVRSGSVSVSLGGEQHGGESEGNGEGGMLDVQTGKELVLVCRQNSLLPGLLELLQSGVGGPASGTGSEEAVRDTNSSGNPGLSRMMSTKGRAQGGRI